MIAVPKILETDALFSSDVLWVMNRV